MIDEIRRGLAVPELYKEKMLAGCKCRWVHYCGHDGDKNSSHDNGIDGVKGGR